MTKVSARSAETILALSKKSTAHVEALIEIAEEIKKRAGSIRIEKMVESIINGGLGNVDEEPISLANGQVVAAWKKGGVFFSKNVHFDKKKFNKMLIEFFKDK
jgi:ParB family chromosome partitioning protein